jgi:hypothetical protein
MIPVPVSDVVHRSADRRVRAWPWLLATAVILLTSFPYFERFLNANERPRLLQGMVLVETGGWAIDDPVTRGWTAGPDIARGPAETGGRLYPNKPPGTSLVAAGAYAVHSAVAGPSGSMRGYVWWARLLGAVLPTLAIVALAWRRLQETFGGPTVLAVLACYVLATPVSSYGRLLFGHQLAAALLYGGVSAIARAMRSERSGALALLGGVLAGSAVAVEYSAAFAGLSVAVFLVVAARRHGRVGSALLAVAGALAPIAGLAAYHAHAFGEPWTTPYHHVTDPGFAEIHAYGLLGLGMPTASTLFEHLLSAWGGLLYWCPLVAVAIVVALRSIRRAVVDRTSAMDLERRLGLAILVTMLVVTLGLTQTGGWRVGPRYFVVALPFAIAPGCRALTWARGRPLALAAGFGLALWSTFVNALAANLFPHLIPVGNPLRDQLLPLWLQGRTTYGLPWLLGLGPAGTSVVVALTLAGLAWAWRGAGADPRSMGRGVVVAAVLAGIAVAVPADEGAQATRGALDRMWEPDPGRSSRSPRPLHATDSVTSIR